MGVLDAIEAQLEAVSDVALADELFAAVAREGRGGGIGDGACSPLLQAAGWLHHLHFDLQGAPRPGKGPSKFQRRLRLLLKEAATWPAPTHSEPDAPPSGRRG